MTLQSLARFALCLVMACGSLTASSQTSTEPTTVSAYLFIVDGSANFSFNVHIDDIKKMDPTKAPIDTISTHMPEINSCTFAKATAQDSFVEPVQPITDNNIEILSDKYITFTALWQCDERPNSMDASTLLNELPSIQSVFVSVITDTPGDEPELPFQISRSQPVISL